MRYHHLMPDENSEPATKADISLLKADISLLRVELKAELASKAALDRLDKKIDRVAAAVVNTQADIKEIRNDMATKMATKDDISRVLKAIDAFAGKSESAHNAVVLHGRILTDVQVGLKDHDGRLKTIESARPA